LAVATTTTTVISGWTMATQRHRVMVVRTTTKAMSRAQPTCRLGMAANWFARFAADPS
jgi:hypothetical protein